MKAVRFYGIENIKCDEIAIPQINDNEVLIKVKYAGICGSDKHIFNKGMFIEHIPETMGHEFVGTIVKLGSKVKNFFIGDNVTANPMIWCNQCESCRQQKYNTCDKLTFMGESRNGCFAEFINVDQKKLVKIPPNLSLKTAVLCEPLAVAIHAVKKAKLQQNNRVAIVGMGPIGILTMLVAKKIYNVTSIDVVDISANRLDFIEKNYSEINTKNHFDRKDEYDVIIDAAGSKTAFTDDILHLKSNGSLYVISLAEINFTIDTNILVNKQLKIMGCNGYDFVDIINGLAYLSYKKIKVDSLITNEFRLVDCKQAFNLLMQSDKLILKIIFSI